MNFTDLKNFKNFTLCNSCRRRTGKAGLHRVKGFSLIELLLAGAVFAVFAWGTVEVLLFGLENDRLGEETGIASAYATEGIEAVRSIRARDFDLLETTDATGIDREDGEWVLSGTDDTNGKYVRTIAIAEVNRDGDGDIVGSGGDADPDTRKVTTTVTWNVTPSRENSVILETYLTRWNGL